MRVLASVTIIFWMTSTATANEFRYEVDGSYLSDEMDFSDSDTLRVSGRYYFRPVADDNGPLAEAAFLQPTSNVSLSYSDIDRSIAPPMPIPIDGAAINSLPIGVTATGGVTAPANANIAGVFSTSLPAGPGADVDLQSFDARYEFVSPTRWLASAAIGRQDGDSDLPFSSTDIENSSYELEVGKYINDKTTLSLGFRYTNAEEALNAAVFTDCFLFTGCTATARLLQTTISRQRQWHARARHLRPLGQMHLAIGAGVRYAVGTINISFADEQFLSLPFDLPRLDQYGINVAAALYPRSDIGFTLVLDYDDAEGRSSNSTRLSAQWFVKPSIALSATLARATVDNSSAFGGDVDTDTMRVSVLGRF